MLAPRLINIRQKPNRSLPRRGSTSSLSRGRTLRSVSEVFFLGSVPCPPDRIPRGAWLCREGDTTNRLQRWPGKPPAEQFGHFGGALDRQDLEPGGTSAGNAGVGVFHYQRRPHLET